MQTGLRLETRKKAMNDAAEGDAVVIRQWSFGTAF